MNDRILYKAVRFLESMKPEVLEEFSRLSDSFSFELIKNFLKVYTEFEKDKFLYTQTEDERKLATEIAKSQGEIQSLKVLIQIIGNAKKELRKRKKD